MIWCVEDDSSIRDIEVYALASTGFEAKGFEDGDSFWNALQSEKPELIVLDVMLPGKDGVTLLKLMKANEAFRDIPVIMATAKGSEYDKIQSLDLGADDYLVKPFGIMEMVSRVKAVLRRCKRSASSNLLKLDGLVLNPDEHTVTIFKTFGFKSGRDKRIYFNVADAGIILYTPNHSGTSLRFFNFICFGSRIQVFRGTLHTFYISLAVLVDTGDGKLHPFRNIGTVITDPLKILGDHQEIQRILTL